ncbi:MAG TPA: Gfo/Idh/MocA family oxidoreductase [Bryobacteraceae bacterium]|nr:Gfo/Idh/MocA family oxidoreductase [Bryobacteraceae bacterium]
MTRRSFASASLAVPLAVAQSPKIRAAMIGTGHGHAHSKVLALQSMPEYEFVGVCRPDKEDPAIGAAFQKVRWLSDAEILGDPTIEMVAMEFADATQNLQYAQKCIDAGKWVHLDKPPGADLGGLRKLLDTAKRCGRIVQMGYQWRYHPAMEAAMHAARQGWLGRVYRFRASIDKPILADERRHLAKYKGGMMFSEGCHLIDRATALLGKPTKVQSLIRHHSPLDDGLADNNLVVLEYSNAIAEISMAGFDPQGNEHRYVQILGSNGSVTAQPFNPVRLHVTLKEAAGPYRAGEQHLEPPPPPGLTYTPDFSELAAVIRKGAAPVYTAQHDLMTHEVLLEACGML